MKPVRLLLSCFIYVKKLYDPVDYIPFFPSWYRFLSTSVVYFYSLMPEKRIFRIEGPSPATAYSPSYPLFSLILEKKKTARVSRA